MKFQHLKISQQPLWQVNLQKKEATKRNKEDSSSNLIFVRARTKDGALRRAKIFAKQISGNT